MIRRRNEIINQDGSISTDKSNKPFYQKPWFLIIAALFLIGLIGRALVDNNEDPKVDEPKPVIEQEEESPAEKLSLETDEETKTEVSTVSQEDEILKILNDNFNETGYFKYDKDLNAFTMVSTSDNFNLGVEQLVEGIGIDNWKALTDSMVQMSRTMHREYETSYVVSIENPHNPDLSLLMIQDGQILYNILDDIEQKLESESNRIKSGTYKIGTDLPAGEYKIFSTGYTYMKISSDSSGSMDSIVVNDYFNTFRYITVEDGEYFEFDQGYALAMADVEPYEGTSYGSGMYKVGFDIPAGEYNIKADGSLAYVQLDSDNRGGYNSIITNQMFETNMYLTISDGQYLTLDDAKIE